MKLYIWTRKKPLKEGNRFYQKGDTVAMSDARANTLGEFLKEVKEVKPPKPPKAPEGLPYGKIQERIAALKAPKVK